MSPLGLTATSTTQVTATKVVRRAPIVGPYTRRHAALGDPTPLACTLAKAVVEAVIGGAELTTLARWFEPNLKARLERQRSLARRRGVRPCTAHVLRVRATRPCAQAAEVSIVVDDGTRSRAVAMRLEDSHGRWLATVIEVL